MHSYKYHQMPTRQMLIIVAICIISIIITALVFLPNSHVDDTNASEMLRCSATDISNTITASNDLFCNNGVTAKPVSTLVIH